VTTDCDVYSLQRDLRAGALCACLDDNGLRNICYDGHEIVRAVYFAMRDESWQTYGVRANSHRVDQHDDAFQVRIEGTAGPQGHELAVSISIDASADGLLCLDVTTTVRQAVLTNRTGIVVLHPLAVSGNRVTVTTSAGDTTEGVFPVLIDPYQPFMSFIGLRHDVANAVSVDIQLSGDIFEMEDQRNWSDASYKTYSRPIGLPWPYTLDKGSVHVQTFRLAARSAVGGNALTRSPYTGTAAHIRFGSASGPRLPLLGLGLVMPATGDQHAHHAAALALVKPGYAVVRAHAGDPASDHTFSWLTALAGANAFPVMLELVLPCLDAPRIELDRVQASMKRAGFAPEAIMLSPAVDLKGVLPGSAWPACPPLHEIYAAAQQVFDTPLIGGGTLAFFTELNRKRPKSASLDFIGFTTCPIVHAADDVSVMQTLACLPHIARSVRALFAPLPYWVGPSSIAARMNPYGADTAPNPAREKISLTHDDVRQFAPFAAAWALGYIAAFAAHGAGRIALSELTGPRGVTMITDGGTRLSPLGELLGALYPFAGCPLLDVEIERDRFAALALISGNDCHVWIANLHPEPATCTIAWASRPGESVEMAGYGVAHIVREAN
jgi:hypothetical protein